MAVNSRQKGARVERAIRDELRRLDFPEARRTAQRTGKTGLADLEGIPGWHIECKGGKRIDVWKAMEQARGDMAEGDVPVVLAKRDRCATLAVFPLEQLTGFIAMAMAAWVVQNGEIETEEVK